MLSQKSRLPSVREILTIPRLFICTYIVSLPCSKQIQNYTQAINMYKNIHLYSSQILFDILLIFIQYVGAKVCYSNLHRSKYEEITEEKTYGYVDVVVKFLNTNQFGNRMVTRLGGGVTPPTPPPLSTATSCSNF